jgi:pyroglutamyl-peptidase
MTGRSALITGFEPYGGRRVNPSAEVVKRLDGAKVEALTVLGRILPVSYRSLQAKIDSLLDEFEPALVLSLGLRPGDPTIRIERVAVNLADFEIADNDGALIRNEPLQGGSPAAMLSTLPLRSIEQALLSAGIPARVSNTAGTFLCNATL